MATGRIGKAYTYSFRIGGERWRYGSTSNPDVAATVAALRITYVVPDDVPITVLMSMKAGA